MNKLIIIALGCIMLAGCSSTKSSLQQSHSTSAITSKKSSVKFLENIAIQPVASSNQPIIVEVKESSNNSGLIHLSSSSIEEMKEWQFKYAVLTGDLVENITNKNLFQFIDDWYGTKYRYGGTTKAGIDCSGFTGMLSNDVYGIHLPRTSREQFEKVQHIPKENLQEGDLVFFNTSGGVSHVGIYISNNKFVHASTSSGVMISDLNEDYYKRRFVGAGRMK